MFILLASFGCSAVPSDLEFSGQRHLISLSDTAQDTGAEEIAADPVPACEFLQPNSETVEAGTVLDLHIYVWDDQPLDQLTITIGTSFGGIHWDDPNWPALSYELTDITAERQDLDPEAWVGFAGDAQLDFTVVSDGGDEALTYIWVTCEDASGGSNRDTFEFAVI